MISTQLKKIGFSLLLLIPMFGNCSTQKIIVHFSVDMHSTGLNLKDTSLNVGLRGSIAPLTWVKGIKLKDPDQDGVYTTTVEFEEETDLYFKYVLNEVEWESGDAWHLKITQDMKPFHTQFKYVKRPGNPFQKFIGAWTLKNDDWNQSNGQEIEQIKIPNHYTLCKEINTDHSLLWIVDATSARGHIVWVYNHDKKEIIHTSSFYPFRSGKGTGTVNPNGDISLKVSFEGEPDGTYRLYTYTWLSEDEYELKSTQYNDQDKPTGSFYGGTFIRIKNH